MNYDYFILVGLEELDDEFFDHERNKFKEVYKSLILSDKNYPKFGSRQRGNYPNEAIENYFKIFSTKFPSKIFIFYCFSFDGDLCTLFKIKNNELLQKSEENLEKKNIRIGNNNLYVSFDVSNTYIDKNITCIFENTYPYLY